MQDDTTSILNIRDYRDILNSNEVISNNLTQPQRDSLSQDPDKLQIRGGAVQPKDNVVAGTDLKMNFLNNRLRFESEAVISALNDNIYGGPLTVERAEELGFDINNSTANLLDQLSWLIIVNENMNTLPLKLEEEEEGEDLNTSAFFPTSILAGNSQVSYRHPNNNLRIQYRWIGPNFYSLANSTVRKDVAGFTITDRLNMLSNRVYLTLGYENLNDNVSGTRRATTNTITYRANASWYPVDINLPRISTGIRFRTRDNDVARENFLLPDDLQNSAVQNVIQERRTINGQDSLVTVVTPAPRLNKSFSFNTSITQQFNFFDARNDVSLSFNTLNTNDEVFAYGDVNSSSFALSMTSRFHGLPLETQVGMNYNSTEAGSGQNEINITGFYVGGNYRLLENALVVNGRVAVTNNSVSSRPLQIMDYDDPDTPRDDYYVLGEVGEEIDYQTYVLQASARYNIDDYHALVFDANFTNVSGGNRANDRIVQLRYVFSF
ncbi:hypothetical protein [Gracilimonas sp.]|uniref:hypothetical protein n=1 Tax=Gracilimonas sp. TaxID=1974203 RepID=UPI002870EFFE|nr:hypothetical protein [Gracilimonas sp.]